MDAIAHAARGEGEHAAELTAAQDADGGSWQDRTNHVSSSRADFGCLLFAEHSQFFAQCGIVIGEDRDSEQSGVLGSRFSDG